MLYLADFGITKQYCHPNTHIHIPFNVEIPLTGTLVFASLNSHMGRELSQHDTVPAPSMGTASPSFISKLTIGLNPLTAS